MNIIINRITSQISQIETFATNPYYAEIAQNQYVIKYIKNDESHISLFNELIGYHLADNFNIKHPDFGYCFYKQDITSISQDLAIEKIEDGDLFTYTKHLGTAIPLMDTQTLLEFTNQEILKLVVFDCFICNTDRNSNNILMKPITKKEKNKENKKFDLIPIDYTHIFPDGVNWNYSLVSKNKDRDYPTVKDIIDGNYYELLFQDRVFTMETLLEEKENFLEILESFNINDYFDKIPEQIICKMSTYELELLVDFFNYRKEKFEYIYCDIINDFERRGMA